MDETSIVTQPEIDHQPSTQRTDYSQAGLYRKQQSNQTRLLVLQDHARLLDKLTCEAGFGCAVSTGRPKARRFPSYSPRKTKPDKDHGTCSGNAASTKNSSSSHAPPEGHPPTLKVFKWIDLTQVYKIIRKPYAHSTTHRQTTMFASKLAAASSA